MPPFLVIQAQWVRWETGSKMSGFDTGMCAGEQFGPGKLQLPPFCPGSFLAE